MQLFPIVEDLLKKNLITKSVGSCEELALLVLIKYRFPIPIMEDMFEKLQGTNVFSKLDLRSRYHQIRIKRGNGWTAFKLQRGCMNDWLYPLGFVTHQVPL